MHARPPGFSDVAQRREVRRPPALADRLEHLDRHDAVVDAAFVAVVLHAELDAIRQAGAGDALARIRRLRVGQRQAGHAMSRRGRRSRRSRPSRSRSRAHVRPGRQAQLVEHAPVLRLLRLRQRHRGVAAVTAPTSTSSSGRATAGRSRCRGRSARRCCGAPAACVFAIQRVLEAQRASVTRPRPKKARSRTDWFAASTVSSRARSGVSQSPAHVAFGEADVAALQRVRRDAPAVHDEHGRRLAVRLADAQPGAVGQQDVQLAVARAGAAARAARGPRPACRAVRRRSGRRGRQRDVVRGKTWISGSRGGSGGTGLEKKGTRFAPQLRGLPVDARQRRRA